jgi:3-phenylpropionate/cinnamic acid dioxygenase small subunit
MNIRWEDWLAVHQLVSRYAWIFDEAPDMEPMRDLFTEDAVFESLPRKERSDLFPFPARGRDEIVSSLGKRQAYWRQTGRRLHLVSNLLVMDAEEDRLRTSAGMATFHDLPDAPQSQLVETVTFYDTIVREADGNWRFSERLASRHNGPFELPRTPAAPHVV